MYITHCHSILLFIIFGNCFKDTTERIHSDFPENHYLNEGLSNSNRGGEVLVSRNFEDGNSTTTSVATSTDTTTMNYFSLSSLLAYVREDIDKIKMDADMLYNCMTWNHDCRVTIRDVVSFYIRYFINNDPTENNNLTKCHVWNCTWYVQERQKFSQNPRQYVDDILHNLNVHFDDSQQKIVFIYDGTHLPSVTTPNIKDLPKVLKLFWFLYTLTNQPPDQEHPSLQRWKEMLMYYEYTQSISSLAISQILNTATRRIKIYKARNMNMSKMEDMNLTKELALLTVCVRCLVARYEIITPEFKHIKTTAMDLRTWTTVSPSSITPTSMLLRPLVTKMMKQFSEIPNFAHM